MKKFIIFFILLSIVLSVVFVSSCKNKYIKQCSKYWNDYDILFVEIVKPSLDIDDSNEFMDYYASDEIIEKIEQLEMILDKIEEIAYEHNLKDMPSDTSAMWQLKSMITAKERYKIYEDKYTSTYPINGPIDAKSSLKWMVEVSKFSLKWMVETSERNIKNYDEYFKSRQ